MKIKRNSAFIFTLLFAAGSVLGQISQKELSKLYKDIPFKMKTISVPRFPDKVFNIVKYGAVGDGISLNTNAFAKAIEECSMRGGGKVVVPAGIWLTGPIYLKNNVNLHLEKGAHIQFSRDLSHYPLLESNWEGYDQYRCASPIMGRNLKNIAITGSGIIDGAGDMWRYVKKFKLTTGEWSKLVSSGGVLDSKGDTWWPSKEALEASTLIPGMRERKESLSIADAEKYKLFFRPVLLSLIDCKDILLEGVTFQNSPAWNLHPLRCENFIAANITVRNPWYSQNGDGIDIESCSNTIIYRSSFDVGDDAICVKSGRDEEGRKRGIPTQNLIVSDCVVYHGHGGFTIGSEMSGGVKNVKIENCNFIGTDVGLRFKSARGRGGVVENVWINGIYMKDIPAEAVSFNLLYGGAAPMEDKSAAEKNKSISSVPVDESTPVFRNIHFSNIICDGAKDGVLIQGLPEMPVTGIRFINISIRSEKGISLYNASSVSFTNSRIISSSPSIYINQSFDLVMDNFEAENKGPVILKVEGEKSRNIIIRGKNAQLIGAKTNFGGSVSPDAVRIMKE